MVKRLRMATIALLLTILYVLLAWYWFGWRMALVLFLCHFAVNADQHLRRMR